MMNDVGMSQYDALNVSDYCDLFFCFSKDYAFDHFIPAYVVDLLDKFYSSTF